MSELRSLFFALFQLIVTPIYAVLVLLAFWLRPVPRFKFITGWCALNLAAARLICGISHRVDRPADPSRGQRHAAADQRGRNVDRGRGRAARKSSGQDAGTARLIGHRQDEADAGLRRVLLAGQDVDYRLIRARRQSIGMTIDNSGLVVRAPRWVTIREIDLALKERARTTRPLLSNVIPIDCRR